ncbi:hypothetical protein [Novosphingobium sp.]|uniref:hypothetical protein n=1 Tax=Novosphingobium sp. TaxID=1874826 RepID=UPI0031CE444D
MKPTYLLDAAALHYSIKPVCQCGHSATFDSMGLWWHYERRGWNDHFPEVRKRFWCLMCLSRARRKVRPVRIEIARVDGSEIVLPLPDEPTWKRYARLLR